MVFDDDFESVLPSTDEKKFVRFIFNQQHIAERARKIKELNVDLWEYDDAYTQAINCLIALRFNDEQVGWIDWWLYERESPTTGKKNRAYHKNGREIDMSTPEKLWKFIKNLDGDRSRR